MTIMKLLSATLKILLIPVLLAVALTGCASARARPPTATLSPDSLALLKEAMEQVRPAYATQEDALRSGVYRSGSIANSSAVEPIGVASGVQSVTGLAEISVGGRWVIQVAAFENRADASEAALLAAQLFPAAEVIIEQSGPYFRVALVGWDSRGVAERTLRSVQGSYPGAWVRTRGVP